MMLLASDYDQSKWLKPTDVDRERKFKIRAVTPEEFNDGKGGKDRKLVTWFTNSEKGLPLNKTTSALCKALSAITALVGLLRSSRSIR
jgi:hypothetical protein